MEISDLYIMKNLRYHAKVNGNESISKMINYIEAAKDLRVHLSSDAGCEIGDDPMEALERLPNLRILKLGMLSFVGKNIMVCHASGFPQLGHLFIDNMPYLENWTVEEGAMPHLSTLTIWDCNKLLSWIGYVPISV
nr:putative disease resistance protein At1g58400 [Coffea arabica]